ncbi:MAG TPA: hypothetical protein VFU05_05280 [Cyclobacteriaceae bacterium]|nr:hypothetical protein [Cyclobacteriaceae bacterium]
MAEFGQNIIEIKGHQYLKFNPAIKYVEEMVNAGTDITTMPATVDDSIWDYFVMKP